MPGAGSHNQPPLRQVDKYEVLSSIGEGGMASVYRACLKAPGGASKQVALKLIHPHLGQEPEFVRMFLDEMRVAMAMSHRNIVQTFDAGRHNENYYLVMELMNGGSLSRLLRTRLNEGERLPLDIALFVGSEVCAALEYAHAFQGEGGAVRGVVHRDVSPGNILLSDQGDVKLADFGVAKVAGRITSSIGGMIKGKLSYMAPEQARGEVETRSDLFAVGAVLHWLVAGVPFRLNPSLEEVRLGTGEVFPRGLRHPELSPSLERVIVSCLSKEPARRPQSAAELRQQLAREMERLQSRLTAGRDPHARLRDFLNPAAPADAGGPQARRLADAMMEMALEVPTNVGHASASGESENIVSMSASPGEVGTITLGSVDIEPVDLAPKTQIDTVVELDLETEAASIRSHETASVSLLGTPRRRQGLWVLMLVAGLGALAATGLVLWWLLSPPDPIPVATPGDLSADVVRGGLAPSRVVTTPLRADATPAARDMHAVAAPADLMAPDRRRRRRPVRPGPRFGRLDLNASPWAKVYLGARYLGETPLQNVRLPAGRHKLRLVNPQRRLSARITVRIQRGRTTRRSVRLTPQ